MRKKLDDAKLQVTIYNCTTKVRQKNKEMLMKMRLQQQILKTIRSRAKVNASEFDTSVTTQDLIAQKAEEEATVLPVEEHYKQIQI